MKYTKEESGLNQLATQAIEQIKKQKYDVTLEGEIHDVGLAHCGKAVEMKWLKKDS